MQKELNLSKRYSLIVSTSNLSTDKTLRWEPFHNKAFTLVKNNYSERTMLHYLSPGGALTLTTDVNGGVLQDNRTDGTNVPLAFFKQPTTPRDNPGCFRSCRNSLTTLFTLLVTARW